MFLLLKQVQPTLNEVPRASTGCHASHDSRRFRQNQAEFEARFRRLDGDSSGKVRSLGMKIGFSKSKRNMICTQNQQKADVIFSHFSYAGWDWVWWVREMVPTLRYTLSDNMWLSAFSSDIVWLVAVPPRVYDDEAKSKIKNNYRCLQWKCGGWPPMQVEVVGSAEKVKRTFEDCNKDEMAEKILWNSQDAIERIPHSPVL